jgi:hypothetical protein
MTHDNDFSFYPGYGMIKENYVNILKDLTNKRLGFYNKYVIKLLNNLDTKKIETFYRMIVNKTKLATEKEVLKYLRKNNITHDFKPMYIPKKKKLNKETNKKRVYKHRKASTKLNKQILMEMSTKIELDALKASYGFKSMEELIVYFILNHKIPNTKNV